MTSERGQFWIRGRYNPINEADIGIGPKKPAEAVTIGLPLPMADTERLKVYMERTKAQNANQAVRELVRDALDRAGV